MKTFVFFAIGWCAAVQADSGGACIIKTVAGTIHTPQTDDSPTAAAILPASGPMAVGPSGALYVAYGTQVLKIQAAIRYVIAGTQGSFSESSGDEGPATAARFVYLQGIAVGPDESVYVFDNHRVRVISPDGVIHAYAGTGQAGFSGDNGPALAARLQGGSAGLAIDRAGNLYISDTNNYRIRRVGSDGIITTVGGVGGGNSPQGDEGPAMSAQISQPSGIGVDNSGRIYFVDTPYGYGRIRMIDARGIIHAFVGSPAVVQTGTPLVPGEFAASGTVAIDNGANRIYFINGSYAGAVFSASLDGGKAAPANVQAAVTFVAVGPGGALYYQGNQGIRELLPSGIDVGIAGYDQFAAADGAPANLVPLNPRGITTDSAGNLYISDWRTNRVRVVGADGLMKSYAGGAATDAGDGGLALDAALENLSALAFDPAGNLYINLPSRIRKVTPDGFITTVAGGGTSGVDGGPANGFRFSGLSGVATDLAGNFYAADANLSEIFKITPDGTIHLFAGGGYQYNAPPGIPATQVQLISPRNLVAEPDGSIWFMDQSVVRRVSADGTIATVNNFGNGAAVKAFTFDSQSNLYFSQGNRVLKLDPSGVIHTIAGGFVSGYQGDGGAPEQALLASPGNLWVDGHDDLFIIDGNTVREVTNLSNCVAPALPDFDATSIPGLAPGKRITLSGVNLGPLTVATAQPDENGFFPTILGGVSVAVNGLPAPLLSAQNTSLTFVVPYQAIGPGAMQITFQGVQSASTPLTVVPQAPAMFLGSHAPPPNDYQLLVYALNQDGSVNSETNPAAAGSIVAVFVTGDGETDPPGIDGKAAVDPLPKPVSAPLVQLAPTFGITVRLGRVLQPTFYGLVPGEIGKTQVNFRVPAGSGAGAYLLGIDRGNGIIFVK